MKVTLYGVGFNRSARCRWTLEEARIEYASVDRRELAGSDELRHFRPLAKVPAAVIDGQTLFESAAICTYIADRVPTADLIAKPGSLRAPSTTSGSRSA
jgi:glutathione S-transferase